MNCLQQNYLAQESTFNVTVLSMEISFYLQLSFPFYNITSENLSDVEVKSYVSWLSTTSENNLLFFLSILATSD